MIRLVFIGLLCAGFFLFFPIEKNERTLPSAWKLNGRWVAEDSASIELLGDGTCLVKHLDFSRFTPSGGNSKEPIELQGVWDYKFFFNRFPVNDLDNENLLILLKEPGTQREYHLSFFIKGDCGLFRDKEPWVLYIAEEKWFPRNTYEFRRIAQE